MQYFFYILLFVLVASCGAHKQQLNAATGNAAPGITQDKFGFIVIDKKSCDSFFAQNKPLNIHNQRLTEHFKALREEVSNTSAQAIKQSINDSFSYNTRVQDTGDFKQAAKVLSAALDTGGAKYFYDATQYLFFYSCLPREFAYKWPQTILGDFRFDADLFALLRTNSKTFDDLIYGNKGYWDRNFEALLGEFVFNEITVESAIEIKKNITGNSIFNKANFAADKTVFLKFLDKVISGEWRLLLLDWN
jgi:hypothetical protein